MNFWQRKMFIFDGILRRQSRSTNWPWEKNAHLRVKDNANYLLWLVPYISISLVTFVSSTEANEGYFSRVGNSYPRHLYWGDTHVHTNLSFDASYLDGSVLGPNDAYLFAKGKAITTYAGNQAKLLRPLDFLVVADHANNMGVVKSIFEDDPIVRQSVRGRKWSDFIKGISQIDPRKFQKHMQLMGEIWL